MPSDSRRSGGKKGESRYDRLGGSRKSALVSYGSVDSEALLRAVVSVTDRGDAIILARTSDGGAFSVRILSEGRTHAVYPSDRDALQELLEELQED